MTLGIVWTPDRVAAVVAGAALWLFLYVFFFGRPRAVSKQPAEGAGEVSIIVSGGYSPSLVVAKRDVPLKLVFDRREDNPCSAEIVLPEFEVRRELAPFAKTEIDLVPRRTGEFPFSCGMNMLHGTIRVEE